MKGVIIVIAIVVLYFAWAIIGGNIHRDQQYQKAYDTRDRSLPTAQGMAERLDEMGR